MPVSPNQNKKADPPKIENESKKTRRMSDESKKTRRLSNGDQAAVVVAVPAENGNGHRRVSLEKRRSLVPNAFSVLTVENFDTSQGTKVDKVSDENKSILWYLIKQLRPGMDLSRVTLPTFILEPRSFLDKMSDYYFHSHLLAEAVAQDDPYERIKYVIKWYMSGFYKKPKGAKKPYNPIIGEMFRCIWQNPNGSTTFYIAEQVSHHPPVSAFYVSNKQDGYTVTASILSKSKFYGNSLSAFFEGKVILTLLPRNEKYTISLPFAHCRGIVVGNLAMELGGTTNIECDASTFNAEIEFKLKGMLSFGDITNVISGKIRNGKDVLATLSGNWDNKMVIKEKKPPQPPPNPNPKDQSQGQSDVIFWKVDNDTIKSRLPRFTIPVKSQKEFESELLWFEVSAALNSGDTEKARKEKEKLESKQRQDSKERQEKNVEWTPNYFVLNDGIWQYKHRDSTPWNRDTDIVEYEDNFVLSVLRK